MMRRRRTLSVFGVGGRPMARPLTRLLTGAGLSLAALMASCSTPASEQAEAPVAVDAYVAHRDPASGAPTFVWLDGKGAQAQGQAGDAREVAWRVLRELAPTYGLSEQALAATKLARLHDLGRGVIIAQFEQEVGGLEVFRLSLNLALNRDLQPVGATGYLAGSVRQVEGEFTQSSEDAVAVALAAMTSTPRGSVPKVEQNGSVGLPAGYVGHTVAAFASAGTRYRLAAPARSKKVWFPSSSGLQAAYYIELDVSQNDQPDSALRSYVVAASDGEILVDTDMMANDSYKYRVWADKDGSFAPWDGPHGTAFTPHPTGKRDGTALTFVSSQLVTLANAPFSKNDPWLPPMSTEARGNNAIAYADIAAPDGLGMGDVMLKPSMPGEFDYLLDVAKDDPAKDQTTIQAVTTNFFYIVNHLHDTYYDAGWDEASRNPQKDNYGRGGVAADPIKAESQDNGGRNNANASTPADGSSPRIQMYLFDPNEDAVKINSPADLARVYQVGRASFGPKNFDVTQNLVVVNDGTGMSPTDGCETPFVNAMDVKDKIAVIDRGNCFYELKVYNAQVNGAKGVVIVNNVPGAPVGMAAGTTPPPMPVTIPAVQVSQEDGALITAKLKAGTAVQMTLRTLLSNNDSSLDGMIVSHEWGHVMSNRLIGNGSGLGNNQGRSMGEGWSDFVALLMTTRPEDATASINADWKGAFAAAAYATGPSGNSAYDGIRRYPYSADLDKNPLMFRHIQNGVALPMMPAPAFGQTGTTNSEVHNSGEVWTSALWECYVALLKDTGRYTFAQASQAMREYLVASLKLTPVNPTMIEARDAVLLAALAKDPKDFELFARAFAKRGMGVGAVAPARGSADHAGVVESTSVGGQIVVESITLTDAGRSCDGDGILDSGELGVLTVKLRNTGTLAYTARATLSNEDGTLQFASGASMAFPTIAPYKTGTSKMLVALNGRVPAGVVLNIKASINGTNLAQPGPVVASRSFVGNYDLVPASAADDSMDDAGSPWTKAGDTKLDVTQPWRQVFENGGGRWFIPDHTSETDQYLVSPPLTVSSTGSFGFNVVHRYSFEADTFSNYDGGVIEISTDAGVTWTDLAMGLTKNGYNGKLWSLNVPLKSRQAFVGKSAGYPAYMTTEANLGTAYQGKTVQLRFRVGTDQSDGAPGWDIDEIAFSGTTNTPFSSRRSGVACGPR